MVPLVNLFPIVCALNGYTLAGPDVDDNLVRGVIVIMNWTIEECSVLVCSPGFPGCVEVRNRLEQSFLYN